MAGPSRGELFELRVARLLHAEGAFVRRRVNLDSYLGEKVQVTDVDVLAFYFDRTLALRLVAAECKTADGKSAPSTKDRLLWLAGVNHLVGATEGLLVTSRAARDGDRRLAHELGLALVDPRDLARRESILGLAADADLPVHSPPALTAEKAAVAAAKDEELKRVARFVRSELWLLEPVRSLKRSLGACRILAGRWNPRLAEAERRAVEWLAAETIIGFTLALTQIAARSYREPEDVFAKRLGEGLAEGLATYEAMQEISKQVDGLIIGVLREAGGDPARAVSVLGALTPRPPAYTEPLFELIQRLAASPAAAAELARAAEAALAPLLLGGSGVLAEAETARLLRLVAAFLERQGRVPPELLAPLRVRVADSRATAMTPERPATDAPPEAEAARSASPSDAGGAPEGDGPPQLFPSRSEADPHHDRART